MKGCCRIALTLAMEVFEDKSVQVVVMMREFEQRLTNDKHVERRVVMMVKWLGR